MKLIASQQSCRNLSLVQPPSECYKKKLSNKPVQLSISQKLPKMKKNVSK